MKMFLKPDLKEANMFLVLLAASFFLIQNISFAQGELDNSFGTGGKVTTNIINTDDFGNSTVVQPDGKIIVVGYSYNGPSSDANFVLVRYNSDGTLDDTFGHGGKVTTDFSNTQEVGNSVALQNDGKIIVAGNSNNQNFVVARYKSNGTLDSTFGTAGKVTTDFFGSGVDGNSVAIQTDGKIIVAGYAYTNFHFNFTLARYNSNGTLDNSFNGNGKVVTDFGNYSQINSVRIDSNQKIMAAGSFYNGGNYDFAIVRYNPDGSLDNTFNSTGKVITDFGSADDQANSIVELPGGILCVAGYSFNGINNDFAVVEYNSDGSLNNSFGSFGKVKTDINNSDDNAASVLMQTDGKLIVSGTTYNGNNHDFAAVRYNSNGTLNNNFGTGGKVVTDFDNSEDQNTSSAIQSDGKIILAGYSNGLYTDLAVVRYNSDGTVDNSFGTNGKVKTDLGNSYDSGNSVVIQKNGKIIVAGSTNNGASYDVAVVRYDSDGSLDDTFGDRGKVNSNFGSGTSGNSAAIQSNGKIIVAGSYSNGVNSDFLVIRYDTSGNMDNNFGQGGSAITDFNNSDDFGSSAVIQLDGRILVAGSSGIDFAVARYNTDGSLDNTFGTGGKVTADFGNSDDIGSSVIVQNDGKIIVAGSSSNGINYDFAMVRFNSDGSIDDSFGSNGKVKTEIQNSEDFESSMLIQPDDKIILVGYSSIMGGNYNLSMVRYNKDGTIDNSFGTDGKVITDLGTSYGYSNSAVLQPDGRIDVAWNLNNGKNNDFVIVRYNNNGSLDNTFGTNGVVTVDFGNSNDLGSAIALQTDGKIIAAGSSNDGYSSDFAVLRYNSLYPVIQVSSLSLQFGNVFIDSSSTKSFFIKNTGSSLLNVDSIIIKNKVFKISQNNFSVSVGDSQKINITFKPVQAQSYSEKLIIYHNAAGNPDTLNLSGNGMVKTNAVISLSTTDINFGTVTVNNSVQKNFFVKNTGTASLVVDSIISNKKVYSANLKNFTVAPGDSQEVKITFTPTDTTNFIGKLSIYHNAPGGPDTINLNGTGTSKPVAIINLSVSQINFGSVTINSSVQKSLIVKNTGAAALVVDSIISSNKSSFLVTPTNFNLAPGDSQEVKATFTPKDSISYSGTLKIYHNASGNPSIINLIGIGVPKAIAIINLSVSQINFGLITINSSTQKSLFVRNSGTAALAVDSLITSNKTVFLVTPVNFNVAPGDSQEVKVTFAPKDSIAYNGTLRIYNNASGSPSIINLSGTGTSQKVAAINLSKSSLSFGDVTVNNSSQLTLNISNSGTADLLVDSIKINNNIFIASPLNFTLKPDSNKDVTVTFTPVDSITYNGILSIYHNLSGSPSTVNLNGKGVSAAKAIITISSLSITFGDVIRNDSKSQKINIKNTGSADLIIDSIASSSSSFTASPVSFIDKPDSSQDVLVTFSPKDSVTYSATLRIYNNASGNPSIISLSGNGFIYPSILSANQSVSFGDVKNINNYKIIGVPGNSNIAVSSLTQGDYQYDWNVYDDNGNIQDYLVTSSSFKFTAGKAYWLISSSAININQQITPVQLNSDNTYSISLHSGWNLISNPFEKKITWQNVINLNSLPANSILYSWNGNGWDNPTSMTPYIGYYFNNTGNLATIKVLYEPHQSAGKIAKEKISVIYPQKFLKLSVEDKSLEQLSSVFVGIDSLSKDGIDNYDYYAPPSDFQKVGISIIRKELPVREKYLFIEQRPEIKDGQEYELEIKSVPNQQINVGIDGAENFSKYNIYLLDERLVNLYNLREEKNIKLDLAHQYNNFKLIIGTNEYVDQIKQKLNPAGYQLYQNYPNPFNPSTVIRFSILKQESITLKVYNILGQAVRTLIDNQLYNAGTHEIEFNGGNLASGVYIFRLESVNYNMQRKMVLIK